jgi:hypothetical protein
MCQIHVSQWDTKQDIMIPVSPFLFSGIKDKCTETAHSSYVREDQNLTEK